MLIARTDTLDVEGDSAIIGLLSVRSWCKPRMVGLDGRWPAQIEVLCVKSSEWGSEIKTLTIASCNPSGVVMEITF